MATPFDPFIDKYGVLVKKNNDGGDSAQRTGVYYSAVYWKCGDHTAIAKISFELALRKLEVPDQDGNYRRYWDIRHWFSQDCVMSRDNMTPLLIGMGVHGMHKRLFNCLLRWLSRCMFMTNTVRNGVHKEREIHERSIYKHHSFIDSWKLPDFAPFHLGLYIRGFRCWPLYPLLCILDLDLFLNSIQKVLFGKYHKCLPYKLHRKITQSADDINHILELLYAQRRFPTPLSYIARLIYKKRSHMKDFGETPKVLLYKTNSGPQSAIQFYFNDGKNPPLDLLLKSLVEAW